ncbi:MAG TPA: hypothetical protein PLL94_14360 [Bacteroidales bacterium]|nr:MAG: hypothetical protein BWX96_02298 [Bacteroidetes bacterium ADurb.Bin145]HOU03436.1 hypothetical protein [Bacteroidales bacterium]HQK69319.1 hypothetical protein [Bacteroidales bacterium]
MRNFALVTVILLSFIAFSCNKDGKSERFELLTTNIWVTDSLLADGIDAGGPGGVLENFKGEAQFKEDGTGTFGNYTGIWYFTDNKETDIMIKPDTEPIYFKCKVVELTSQSFKITTSAPDRTNPAKVYKIRMTFKPK